MTQKKFPKKLKRGDHIRIIAPSTSLNFVSKENQKQAIDALKSLELKVSFGKHVLDQNILMSSSIESRVVDIHEAFKDPTVHGILTVLGGYHSNQLLDYLDYNLIRNNPKIFCGFSDITALGNALYHKADLVTYSGPDLNSFGMKKGLDYTLEYFQKVFFQSNPINLIPSTQWSENSGFSNQENRTFYQNSGYKIHQTGSAQGTIIGGNLCTFQLLKGTIYMPSLDHSILFIEEVVNSSKKDYYLFDRQLQSLVQSPDFKNVQGIVIGRFENSFGMTEEILNYIIDSKEFNKNIPIISNADFGHTTPIFTFPIGGICSLKAENEKVSLILESY